MSREKTAQWAGERIRDNFSREISQSTIARIINYIVQVEETAEKRGEEKAKEAESVTK